MPKSTHLKPCQRTNKPANVLAMKLRPLAARAALPVVLSSLLTLNLSAQLKDKPEPKPAPPEKAAKKADNPGPFDVDPNAKPEDFVPRQILTHVEFIEMPHTELTKLLSDINLLKDEKKLYDTVQKLITDKKAKTLTHAGIIGRSNERSRNEAVKQVIYATEYEPADIVEQEKDKKTGLITPQKVFPFKPTAFEERSVGCIVEVEPQLGDNDKVSITLSPKIVYKHDDQVIQTWKDGEEEHKMTMPHFYRMKVTTGADLQSGVPALLAAVSPQDEKGITDRSRKVLVFCTCTVLKVGANK